MSEANANPTIEQELIDRQSVRMGQMATQIEFLRLQLEKAGESLSMLGFHLDGSPIQQEPSGG